MCNVLSWIPPLPGKGLHFLHSKDNSSLNTPPLLCSEKSFTCLGEGRGHSLVDPVFGYPWFTVHRKKVYFHAKWSGPLLQLLARLGAIGDEER